MIMTPAESHKARDEGPVDAQHYARAILNILEDASGEKTRLEATQKAILNILDDFDSEKNRVEQTNREMAREITERERADEARRESEARLQAILDNTTAVIYLKDTEGRYIFINRQFEALFHVTNEEIVGKTDHAIFPKEMADVFRENDRSVLETGAPLEVEEVAPQDDGVHTYISVKFPLRDPAGVPHGVCGISTDITGRKHAEEAVHQARVEADRASQAKSVFLSRMSHELRTPLNAILGFGQLLEMDSLSPEQRESVGHVLKGGRHLLDLINEVLDIARIEAGRLAISPEPVSLTEVIQESLDMIAPLAAEQDIQLNGHDSKTDQYVRADRQRLKQVLLNLLSNAVKYNRKGGIVAVETEELPEDRLRIKVSDNGLGIPPERLERLFTPFERLGAEQTGVEGTGLGLALSKGLTDAMGGTLGVESTVGQGSTFWLEFPRIESPVEQLKRMGHAVPAPAQLEASSKARIVLYVEDNLSNVKLIQRLLAHRPEVRLLPIMQGRLGLDLAREHRPHLILLDLHLPDIPGEEVLRQLREAPETREIPVVIISADATSGQIKRLLAAGAYAYLTKPIDIKKFLDVLDETLKG